jgi:hypothetical protein
MTSSTDPDAAPESAIPDDAQLRPAVSHRMLVVLTTGQRGATVLIAGKPTWNLSFDAPGDAVI